ncbi:hypothetical protein BH23GEM6_BH23GEM6_14310 [soil metagenome]
MSFRRNIFRLGVLLIAATPLLPHFGAADLHAQQIRRIVDPRPSLTTPLPFGPGERAEYQVRLGALSVGSGAMEILGVQQVNGGTAFHTRMRISGGLPFARVNDVFESWIDVDGIFSRRFKQDQHELNFRRNRTYDFFPDRRTFLRENGETGTIPTNRPLDDVSFLYYVRTLPLRVGDVYEVPRYFKEDGNPVVIRVVRKETVRVPAGTFQTVVIQPIIKTDGLFGEGGQAEVFFTDDARRMLVQMRSRVPLIGSLTLHLRSYRAGEPYAAGGATAAGPAR